MKANRLEVLNKVSEVLADNTDAPADEIRALGTALVKIADALEGLSVCEARAVIEAAAKLNSVA